MSTLNKVRRNFRELKQYKKKIHKPKKGAGSYKRKKKVQIDE